MNLDATTFKANALAFVDAPVYPDPNTQPVPSPLYQQVVIKPQERKKTVVP